LRELSELAHSKNVTVVLAHIERYLRLQSKDVWERLYENGIRMQVNASFFAERMTRRRALGLLADGGIHFIGSDSHNMTSRPPRIGDAFEVIEKKFGRELLDRYHSYGASVLC
jgi:protein-tyrosine phosphatase